MNNTNDPTDDFIAADMYYDDLDLYLNSPEYYYWYATEFMSDE
jgi:hypothetical protein